jgi:hypothetical protein
MMLILVSTFFSHSHFLFQSPVSKFVLILLVLSVLKSIYLSIWLHFISFDGFFLWRSFAPAFFSQTDCTQPQWNVYWHIFYLIAYRYSGKKPFQRWNHSSKPSWRLNVSNKLITLKTVVCIDSKINNLIMNHNGTQKYFLTYYIFNFLCPIILAFYLKNPKCDWTYIDAYLW